MGTPPRVPRRGGGGAGGRAFILARGAGGRARRAGASAPLRGPARAGGGPGALPCRQALTGADGLPADGQAGFQAGRPGMLAPGRRSCRRSGRASSRARAGAAGRSTGSRRAGQAGWPRGQHPLSLANPGNLRHSLRQGGFGLGRSAAIPDGLRSFGAPVAAAGHEEAPAQVLARVTAGARALCAALGRQLYQRPARPVKRRLGPAATPERARGAARESSMLAAWQEAPSPSRPCRQAGSGLS